MFNVSSTREKLHSNTEKGVQNIKVNFHPATQHNT